MSKPPNSLATLDSPSSSMKAALAYGPGGLSENLAVNSIAQLVNAVFAISLGVNPALVGIAMAIPRFVDAFTDPIMGSISDNWRGRWGRRRPFILAGSVFSGMCVALVWWTPQGATPTFHFYWLVVFLLLSTVGTTMFGVPYIALGMEQPATKNERTVWMAWRSGYHKFSGIGVQWLFSLVQLSFFSSVLMGARAVGLAAGAVVAALGAIPAIFIRERSQARSTRTRVPLFESWRLTIRDRNFLVLAGATVLIFASILLVDTLGFYLMVYYVFGGDLTTAAFFKGVSGTGFHVVGMAFIPVMTWLSQKLGKRRAFELCIWSIITGGVAKFFCYIPDGGWLVLLPSMLIAPGLVAVLVLVPSMLADVAAADEQATGNSRQGMYAASMAWVSKLANSGVALLSGIILVAGGWVHELGVAQEAATYTKLRWAFTLGTILLAGGAGLLMRLYKLDDKTAA